MKNLINKILQLFLLPLVIAGAFFFWSLPHITSDYNFNSDELIYLDRTKYAQAYFRGDFTNPIWKEWGAYDQPQLTNYLYALVPGDRDVINSANSPCHPTQASFYNAWSCLDGPPISTWNNSLQDLKQLVTNARTFALGISSLALATTYYLGLLIAGPLVGIFAATYLGFFSFFRNLSTMVMMDQFLLLLLNLQAILFIFLTRKQKPNLIPYLALGLITGLSASTKFSALIPTLLIYSLLAFRSLPKTLISATIATAIFFSLHPNLWNNPISNLTQMLTWRTTQLSSASTIYQPTSLQDKLSYSITELFTSNNSQDTLTIAIPLFLVFLSSLIPSISTSPYYSSYSLLNLILFIFIIPVKWNRYLLPALPFIAISLSILFNQFILLIKRYIRFLLGIIIGLLILAIIITISSPLLVNILIFIISLLLALQGLIVTRTMLHKLGNNTESIPSVKPHTRFSLLIPAKNESLVIGNTLSTLASLNYPKNLFEILVITPANDTETIHSINRAIASNPTTNIRFIPVDGETKSKAYSLNVGLHFAQNDYIGIFDAEDEVHPNLLKKVSDYLSANPTMHAVQAPVHLTNLNSNWFSSLNAIEYYFWFKSVLPFLSTQKTIPLGGNTIFVYKKSLKKIGQYDETCLTEDADLGIRLSTRHANIGILTDQALATREETPATEIELINQRSRWDQGYLQVIGKQDWRSLSPQQRLLTLYLLTQPLFRHLSFLNMIFAPLLVSIGQIPLWLALFSFLPAYFLILQLGLYLVGLSDLAKLHHLKLSPLRYLLTLLAFIPYQALLFLATSRALYKIWVGNYQWDKTSHYNHHRPSLAILNK